MTSNDFQQAALFIQNHLSIDDTPGELDHLRFSDALTRHASRKRRRRLAGSAVAVGLTTCVAVLLTRPHDSEVLTYEVGHSGQKGVIGSYVSAPRERPLDIHFSEGSDIILAPSARGRIAQTTPTGATVVLEDGRARADIVHKHRTQWQILAGPYVVGVTGTSFDVAFNVATQTFELDMHSGSVRVTGPGLKTPIEIRDQQRLTLTNANRESRELTPEPIHSAPALFDVAPSSAVGSACPLSETTTVSSEAVKVRASAPPLNVEARAVAQESFTRLGAKGEHSKILELAEQSGFDTVTNQVNSSDLMALGNAARFSGKSTVANKAYGAVRQRFAGSAEAASAAFFLGRLAETSNPSAAMSWYAKYQAEAPNGVWISDALGRSLVLSNQLKGRDNTLAAATEYLERFPTGPYAGFARKLLSL